MPKVKVYNQKAEMMKELELPARVFGMPLKRELVYQALIAQQANSRKTLAHTKDRSEVRGGGKKPWRQKGTGRARHGSSRSPLWVGGGVTFGPTNERNFGKKINGKMRQKALFMLLSDKVSNNALFVLDKLELAEQKTKQFSELLKIWREKITQEEKIGNLLLVAGGTIKSLVQVSRNLPKTRVIGANNLNVEDLLKAKNIIVLEDAIAEIEKVYKKI